MSQKKWKTRKKKMEVMVAEVNELFHDPELEAQRVIANGLIIRHLAQYLKMNPTIRFCQALRNLDIIKEVAATEASTCYNEFNTEPMDTLKRVEAVLSLRKP